jgi:FtsH-binding integral membrane protein
VSDPRPTNPYPSNPVMPGALPGEVVATPVRVDAATQRAYLAQAFLWMFAGLALTAALAWVVQGNERLLRFALDNLLILIIGQLALALAIQFGIRRMSATVALGAFFVYAASLGLTIGLIVSVYASTSVVSAFLTASGMFGGAAIYGHVTKRSLAGLGGLLAMAVIGLLVALVINVFLQSEIGAIVISLIGVVLFTILTAYHVQRIQNGDLAVWTGSTEKAAVMGALLLYLDFVNLFLFLLRLFGNRE